MRTVYLCTPLKSRELALQLVGRIEKLGLRVLCPVNDIPRDLEPHEIFRSNVDLIRECDLFVAVLKDYGKDLAAETGMAYAWGKTMIGLDWGADPTDIMVYHAFDKIVDPSSLEETVTPYLG